MTMIERVARAICEANAGIPDEQDDWKNPHWTLYIPEARAAIEAMREPSDAMETAGQESEGAGRGGKRIYQDVIDAALKEQP